MNARFRVRYREGGDATVGSLGEFYDLVQAGGIKANDLVHDGLTGEWVPARAHPVYWLCTDPLVTMGDRSSSGSNVEAVPLASGGRRTAAAEPVVSVAEAVAAPASEFVLAHPPTEPTPEEAARAFVQRMALERAEDPDQPSALADFSALDAVLVPAARTHWSRVQDEPSLHSRGEGAEVASETSRPARPGGRTVHLSLAFVLVLGSAGVAGGIGLAMPGLFSFSESIDGLVLAEAPRRVTASETEVRRAAYQSFLVGVSEIGDHVGVGAVPDAWLEGRYLADAGAYPEVAAYWARHRDHVSVTRIRASELYRGAYLAELEALGVEGPLRSLRLATAMADFSASASQREYVYMRLAELADAAMALHDLSAAASGRISYEPARANRVSADPVIEAAGRDVDMQQALEAALDRVLAALPEGDGPGPGRDRVVGWMVEELARVH